MSGNEQGGQPRPDRGGAALLYQQVMGAIATRIRAGDLKTGDRVPSVRELARESDVTHVTAWRGLRQLSDAGVLTVQPGVGTRVSEKALTRLAAITPPRPAVSENIVLPSSVVSASGSLAQRRRRPGGAADGRVAGEKLFRAFSRDMEEPLSRQIFLCVAGAVARGDLQRGDRLPSLKETGRFLAVSVATVAHAYRELQRSGIIEATASRGYFVSADTVTGQTRVFLLFDELNAFKEDLYNAFRQELGEQARIELFFHHYRRDVFEDLLQRARGRYHFYVMIPHPERAAHVALDRFDPREVLLIDQRHGIDGKYSIICQDFKNDTYRGLLSARQAICAYEEFILLAPEQKGVHNLGPFAEEIEAGFRRFCREAGLPQRTTRTVTPEMLRAGVAFLVIGEEDLVGLVQAILGAGMRIGADVGVVAYNESLLKQVIGGGISTLSTNFARMGREAARHITEHRAHTDDTNPSALTVRASLRRVDRESSMTP